MSDRPARVKVRSSMDRPFSRLAIVNRGEAAMRVIHAVRELNEQRADPIRIVALHTEAERDAMFVRQADEAVGLDGGYRDGDALERALTVARADAVWVGWGLVAERAEFAELCERLGIVFVGPDAAVMRLVGDKIAARRLAEEAGVPVAPWSGGPVDTVDEALRHAARIGFPLLITAAAGRGGRGSRRVDEPEALAAAFAGARSAAKDAFGDGTALLEKLVSPARHVEVQVIADGHGGAWAVGVRDCTYKRRNQNVIEESASPALAPEQERQVLDAARRLALRAGYRNAGTVEFLYEPATRAFSFLAVDASLQAEHAVTEAVTGLDLVKLQLHVAAGGRLEGEPPPPSGHAVEARLNAEDPALDFVPTPGRIALLRLPTGPGVRVDTGVAEGDVVPAELDSTIAKVVAWGHDRDEALARLRRALAETMLVIDGGTTNQGFLLALLERPEVRSGEVDTTWLDRLRLSGEIAPARHADVALLQAAIAMADGATAADRARFYAFARRGRPQAGADLAHAVELRQRGQSYRLAVSQVAPDRHQVTVDGVTIEVLVKQLGRHEHRLQVADRSYRTLTSIQDADVLVEVNGVPHRMARDDGGLVRNPAPAVVVSIPVAVGDEVDEGDVVAVVEAMKTETSLTAPFHGRVREVLVGTNVHVAAEAPLVALEPLDGAPPSAAGERLAFTSSPPAPAARDQLARLGWLVLGYDVDGREVERIAGDPRDDPELLAGEHRLLRMFADVRALSRPRHDEADPETQWLRSPQEHLHAWLGSLDPETAGLPDAFLVLLRAALAHYGITELDRTPALEEACYRLYLAQERAATARAAIVAILERHLDRVAALTGASGTDFREALDHLVAATEGRDPVVADLAREVRYRAFDQPVIAAAHDRVYTEMEAEIAALAEDPERSDRDERIAAVVACPRPLAALITARMGGAAPPLRRVLVEAMARRYYRVRSLSGFEPARAGGQELLMARYPFEGRQRHLAAAYIDLDHVRTFAEAFARYAAALPRDDLAVLDLYAECPGETPSHDELAATLRAALAPIEAPEALHRIVVAVARPTRGLGMSAIDTFTFRRTPSGLAEDELLRGLHPMMGHRLQLWRLQNFGLERLPSPEDVYAFRGVAHANAKDERLFALAEVRDLTPVRDHEGRVAALPELERILGEVLETIRGFQARRPPSRRLLWNRIQLYVWPVIELSPEEINAVMRRLAPSTLGLGIEHVLVRGRMRRRDGTVHDRVLRFFTLVGEGVVVEVGEPSTEALLPLDDGARRIVAARRRGMLHPAEIVRLLAPVRATPDHPAGTFVEHDLDDDGALVPVHRPPATNQAGIVVGTVRNVTERYPEGMLRVILLGDPTRALGSLAEPECRRIIAAIDLAEELGVPLEWFALSAGAKIAMDSGTENIDWVANVLRRIVHFTQAGGEINVVVAGINVGAQPYWNAEATMLMHTRGILVMTPESAMVLTGKQALDYSGGVSAEDNFGIGGYERIMGPNGQAQYWAPDIARACRVLLSYYEHAYVAPGERFPRRAATSDPADRDIGLSEHRAPGSDLLRVGDIFSDERNPGRKKPFDIRSVMRAVIDADHPLLERWAGMARGEVAVVTEAHLGGWPVSMIGIESRPLPRHGAIPADGPDQWTSGTLFPRASKKIARAINAASGRRPLVVLANLAGFDGSPESMREWQLEFGAEIGRAVVNFDGPIVFCVVSRYHGGASVVFSQQLNPNLEAVAVEGAHASVIGGAPAAAVVFARDVEQTARDDERIATLDERIADADGAERQRLRTRREALWEDVLAEKRGELAARFDAVHSVERAVRVGSMSGIVAAASLRSYLIDAVERGMRRALNGSTTDGHAHLAPPLPR
jgi:acetyl/propionyl-CoA carboxylase alpha subunit/acetyl-CoA carboxylase carboxyltransferase component